MPQIITNNYDENAAVLKAAEFFQTNFGSLEALNKTIMAFAADKLAVEGKLSRTDYDLFHHHVIAHIQLAFNLSGLILTKTENE